MEALKEIQDKMNKLIEDAEKNQRVIDRLCKSVGCDAGELEEKVKDLSSGNLTNDADFTAEQIAKICADVCKEIVDDNYHLYEEEPRMESDNYGDEITITLECNSTYMDSYYKDDIVTISMERLEEQRVRNNTPVEEIIEEYVERYKKREDEYGINTETLEVTRVQTGEVIHKAERPQTSALKDDVTIKITGGYVEPVKKAPAKKTTANKTTDSSTSV